MISWHFSTKKQVYQYAMIYTGTDYMLIWYIYILRKVDFYG